MTLTGTIEKTFILTGTADELKRLKVAVGCYSGENDELWLVLEALLDEIQQ